MVLEFLRGMPVVLMMLFVLLVFATGQFQAVVVGLVLYNKMIKADWDGAKESVTLRDLVRHVERVCELAGDTRHVALGSDFDGGFGLEGIPAELTRWGDLRLIGGALAQQGWSDRDIANLLGGSWRRWLSHVLP